MTTEKKVLQRGLKALRNVLKRMRWDDQGGYPSYRGNGRWGFVSTGLPQTTPAELNALFELAGIEPDVIVPKGDCRNCLHSINGRERVYGRPCLDCKRPRMSNFKSKRKGTE